MARPSKNTEPAEPAGDIVEDVAGEPSPSAAAEQAAAGVVTTGSFVEVGEAVPAGVVVLHAPNGTRVEVDETLAVQLRARGWS